MECYYYKKINHIAWNNRFWTNDIFKGKVNERPHATNVTISEDSPDADSGDDVTREREF